MTRRGGRPAREDLAPSSIILCLERARPCTRTSAFEALSNSPLARQAREHAARCTLPAAAQRALGGGRQSSATSSFVTTPSVPPTTPGTGVAPRRRGATPRRRVPAAATPKRKGNEPGGLKRNDDAQAARPPGGQAPGGSTRLDDIRPWRPRTPQFAPCPSRAVRRTRGGLLPPERASRRIRAPSGWASIRPVRR